jgi:hypothetical protein
MWQDYSSLVHQRIDDLYQDASASWSLPPKRRRHAVREALGRALMRFGERLAGPVGSPVAHR